MYLYKFSNVNINKLSCLASKTIWFSKLKNCNDPFEGAHAFIEHEDEKVDKMKQSAAAVIGPSKVFDLITADKLKEFSKQKISDILNCGILSLSEHCEDKRPHLNNLMWSHYADGLAGYCLKFNKDKLISSIYHMDDISQLIGKWAVNVEYSPQRPEYDMLTGNDPIDIIRTKSDHWTYENEFRLISRQSGKHKYSADSLEEIILGEKMPMDQKKLICDIIKSNYSNIKFKQAVLQEGEYTIDIVDLDYDHLCEQLNIINRALSHRDILDLTIRDLTIIKA